MKAPISLRFLGTFFGLCLAVYSLSAGAAGLSSAGVGTVRGSKLAPSKKSLFVHAKIVGQDNRQGFDDFAHSRNIDIDEFYAQFEAVGQLTCPHLEVSAQLIETSGLVLTAGHIFFFEPSCEPIDISQCEFQLRKGDEIIKRKIKSGSVDTGPWCETKQRRHDWAFFELAQPIPGVRPFLAPTQRPILKGGDSLVQATWSASNYRPLSSDPRHIQNCAIKVVDPTSDTVPMETDCDTGNGSSGSAQLMNTQAGLVVVGINNSEFVNGKDGDKYQPGFFGNVSVPLTGDLFDRLWQRINALSNSEDQAASSLDLEYE